MLLPQFKMMWPQFSHIVPIFVRTLAVMFEQAQLIPPNHPATKYGMANVGKIYFRDLIGEAWFNLRTQEGSTPYQYGLFASVIMMIVLIVATIGLALAQLITVTAANAQLFTHPTIADTSLNGVAAYGGTQMTDMTLPGTGSASPDFAIAILDKVLRQAAVGPSGIGGPMQNALGPLLSTYSSAVLVLASFLIAWAVISIVVDAARTGQVGGGRHNLVWAPIRFVFALGLLIPFSNGFNSGQIIIMKFAEMGSNLGTNGWVNYVTAVTSNLVITPPVENSTGLVIDYAKIKVCEKAYNGYQEIASDGDIAPLDDQWVTFKQKQQRDPYPSYIEYVYTNNVADNLCGTLKVPNPDARELRDPNATPAYSTLSTDVVAQVKNAIRQNALLTIPGLFAPVGNRFGCDFLYTSRPTDPADYIDTCGFSEPVGTCGGAGWGGRYPDRRCIQELVEIYYTAMNNSYTADVQPAINAHFTGGGFLNIISTRGWAGMGMWYHEISRLNRGVIQALDEGIVTKAGALSQVDVDKCGYGNQTLQISCTGNEQKRSTAEILSKFDEWWKSSSRAGVALAAVPGAATDANAMQLPEAGGIKDLLSASASPDNLINTMVGWTSDPDNYFLMSIVPDFETTYPMAILTEIGDTIVTSSMWTFGLLALISIIGGFLPDAAGGDSAKMIMMGVVGDFLGFITTLGFVPGMVLLYYVPLIPWIRVIFAVVAWIVSVFEAVVMVPVVALAHLTTQGEGLVPQGLQGAYVLYLNILLRPILTVIGFIGATLIFNAMVPYIWVTMQGSLQTIAGPDSASVLGQIVYTIIFVALIYTLANSTFKLVDMIPNATMKWIGGPQDASFEDSSIEGMVAGGAQVAVGAGQQLGKSMGRIQNMKSGQGKDTGASKA